MTKPKISVVIPTHNRPALLKRAIESALNQKTPAFEILIVDDANCSETEKLVYSYSTDKIAYIKNKDGSGASSSRNVGAKVATGEYIAFLDDDDVWLPDKLLKQSELITQRSLDAVFSRILIKYEDTDISYSTSASMPEDSLEAICMENFIGATISSVIRRQLFIKVNGFDEEFPAREEYDLWIRLIQSGADIDVIEEPLCISFRSLNNRERISRNIVNYENAIRILNQKHRDLIESILSEKKKKIRISRQYEFLAAQGISIDLRLSPSKYYLKSFINKPAIKPLILAFMVLMSPMLLIKLRARKNSL
jgi:glycosyltransferase involved in cell wall biosynthesis